MQYRSAIASPSTTDPIGTVGVDMAANPLTLGYRTLVSAVNMRSEQGVLRTRPAFNYQSTGTDGQFQGAFHYCPSKGLSARPFAPEHTALAFVVGGKLYIAETSQGLVACASRPLCGPHDFACRGPVDIFQAENWLILQNERSNTFFWEGGGCLLESPGLGEDPEDTDPAVGKAPPPSRGRCWSTNTYVLVTVVDDANGKVIVGADVQLKVGSRIDYSGATDAYGESLFYPVPKTYVVNGSKAGYNPATRNLTVIENDTKFVTLRLTSGVPPITPTVRFTVLNDLTNAPISSADVSMAQGISLLHSGLTNGSGVKEFPNVIQGAYEYTVSKAGFEPAIGVDVTVTETNPFPIVVRLVPLFTVQFTVTNSLTNLPISTAGVVMGIGGTPTFSGLTSGSGQRAFSDVAPATYSYTVSKAGFVPSTANTTVGGANPHLVSVQLTPVVEEPPADTCGYTIGNISDDFSIGLFRVTNTGTSPLTVVAADIEGGIGIETATEGAQNSTGPVDLPFTLAAGEWLEYFRYDEYHAHGSYTVSLSCGGVVTEESGILNPSAT